MPSPATLNSSATRSNPTTRPLQAVFILSGLYFLARFTGLLQRQIISALLPSAATDAYSYAFGLPDLLNYIVAGGAISLTFIPIFTRFWEKGREAEAWRFLSTLISLMGVVLVGLTVVMMVFTPQLLFLRYPGIVEQEKIETYHLAIKMTRIIIPAQLFFYLGGLFVGVLNTFKRFSATGFTSALNNVVAILVGVVLLRFMGPIGFAWGILLGAFCGNFLLPYLSMINGPVAQRPRFTFRFNTEDPAVRRFFVLALPIMFGVSLPVVDQFVVTFFASFMRVGTVTHLENANRLMIAAQGVMGQAAAVAAFPYMASESAKGEYRAFSEFLRTGLRRLLFVSMPISVLLVLWAQPIVRLLYGYGQFNQPAKLHETALCFGLYTIGLFAWVGQGFVARGFYALGDTRTPTIIGTLLTFAFFIPICFVASRFDQAWSLALVTSIGAAAYFVSIVIALSSKLSEAKYRAPLHLENIMGTFLRTGTACLLMAIAGYIALKIASGVVVDDKLGDIGLILWTGAIAGAVFAFSATRFQIPEWIWLRARFDKLRRRGKSTTAI